MSDDKASNQSNNDPTEGQDGRDIAGDGSQTVRYPTDTRLRLTSGRVVRVVEYLGLGQHQMIGEYEDGIIAPVRDVDIEGYAD